MRWNSGWVFLCCAGVFAVVTFCVQAQGGEENIQRPNVVLIVGDDIGFSDIGCFGSEVNTPNLDRLGMGGMRFTQFYNMSKCNPTRS